MAESKSSFSTTFSRKITTLSSKSPGFDVNNLISAQKTVNQNLLSTSTSIKASSKFLSSWGSKEGHDLLDITAKNEQILEKLADTFAVLSSSLENYRIILKDIRNADENFTKITTSRQKLVKEIEATIKKNKPVDQLNADLLTIDKQILDEEALLYSLKRQKLFVALHLQADSFADFSSKIDIISKGARNIASSTPQIMLAAGQTAPSYSGEAFTAQIVTETINSLNQVKPSDLRGIPVVNQNFQESSRFRTGSVISSDDGDQRRSRVTTTESTQSHQVLGNPFAEDEPAEKYTPYYAQNPYQ